MDAFDVEGVCFSHFTLNDWLSGRARKYLEAMIVAAGADCISPASIYLAFFHANTITIRNLPPEERRKRLSEEWEKMKAKQKSRQPVPADWTF